jgi:hypothetical protein
VRVVDKSIINEFRLWKGHKYILISGYEKSSVLTNGGIPPLTPKYLVGIAIHGPVIGTHDIGLSKENRHECEAQQFQLSPVHRVYGFQKARMRLDPMMTVKFGIDNDNWEGATKSTGRTRIAFMEDMNECVFEHGTSCSQDESQRWIPHGRGDPGVMRLTVDAWEVWGFDDSPHEVA